MASDEKMFPIMGGPKIPWAVIGLHEHQAGRNHGQTLKELAGRGGLWPCEAVAVLEDRRWHTMTNAEALARLEVIVKDRYYLVEIERLTAALAEAGDTMTAYDYTRLVEAMQNAEARATQAQADLAAATAREAVLREALTDIADETGSDHKPDTDSHCSICRALGRAVELLASPSTRAEAMGRVVASARRRMDAIRTRQARRDAWDAAHPGCLYIFAADVEDPEMKANEELAQALQDLASLDGAPS